jgi:hypothetical protein
MRKRYAATELRRDCRYAAPLLEVIIDGERFLARNWSMRGVLLDGICEAIGSRVRGLMGVAGSRDAIPFAATVIRIDLDTGNSAICFEDFRTEALDFRAPDLVAQLH